MVYFRIVATVRILWTVSQRAMIGLLSKEVLVPIGGDFVRVEDEYTLVSCVQKLLGHTHLPTHTLSLGTSLYRIPKKNKIKLSITIFQEK